MLSLMDRRPPLEKYFVIWLLIAINSTNEVVLPFINRSHDPDYNLSPLRTVEA